MNKPDEEDAPVAEAVAYTSRLVDQLAEAFARLALAFPDDWPNHG